MDTQEGLKILRSRYGNPKAVFAKGKFELRQKVAVIVDTGYLIGTVERTNGNGKTVIKVTSEQGKVHFITPKKSQILVQW